MILCVPIEAGRSDELLGVLELSRRASEPPFGPEDVEIVQGYLSWAGVALNCAHSHTSCVQEKLLNEAVAALTRHGKQCIRYQSSTYQNSLPLLQVDVG